MGTNYYARYNHCDCCGRYDEIHVGKSFRMLRAYNEYSVVGPINSWADWKEWIAKNSPAIFDEYGTVIGTNEFVTRWAPIPGMDKKLEEELAEWRNQFLTNLGDFLDDEGFRFSIREFS